MKESSNSLVDIREIDSPTPFFGRVKIVSTAPEFRSLMQNQILDSVRQHSQAGNHLHATKGEILDINIYGSEEEIKNLLAILKAQNQAVRTVFPDSDVKTSLYIAPTERSVDYATFEGYFGRDQRFLVLNNDFVSTVRGIQFGENNSSNNSDVRLVLTGSEEQEDRFDSWKKTVICKHGLKYFTQEKFPQSSRIQSDHFLGALNRLKRFGLYDIGNVYPDLPQDLCYANVDLNGGTIKVLNGEMSVQESFNTYLKLEKIFRENNVNGMPISYDEESASWLFNALELKNMFNDSSREISSVLKTHDFKMTAFRINRPSVWIDREDGTAIPVLDIPYEMERSLELVAKSNGKNFAHNLH